MSAGRLDIHCEVGDGFALCDGDKGPCVLLERFLYLCGTQRCAACTELTATESS